MPSKLPDVDPFRPPVEGGHSLSDVVQEELEAFAAHQHEVLAEAGSELVPFVDAALSCVRGGKRLRAAYCYWGWRAAGGDPGERRVLAAAASLEWLHSSALVHDDVMDGSDVRRGRPAVHREFEARHRAGGWAGDPVAFGVSAAILLGDVMLSWADEMFRACGLDCDAVIAAEPCLDACKTEVIAGQFLDVVTQSNRGASVETAMRVIRYKSAKYTVERPLHLGATLAGAGPDLLRLLSAYAIPVGDAFQLRDDVLGVFGDPEVTGKPAGDDLREGKRTVLVARALDRATPQDRAELVAGLGAADLAGPRLLRLRDIIAGTGALAAVETQIADLETAAATALATIAMDPTTRSALSGLAALSTRRHR
ncbi:MAG: polyprenyl synthetase family protein [Nocardioidaceae bacterium]